MKARVDEVGSKPNAVAPPTGISWRTVPSRASTTKVPPSSGSAPANVTYARDAPSALTAGARNSPDAIASSSSDVPSRSTSPVNAVEPVLPVCSSILEESTKSQ
jgi:hypothetical protein